jgi:hypothetical protein
LPSTFFDLVGVAVVAQVGTDINVVEAVVLDDVNPVVEDAQTVVDAGMDFIKIEIVLMAGGNLVEESSYSYEIPPSLRWLLVVAWREPPTPWRTIGVPWHLRALP